MTAVSLRRGAPLWPRLRAMLAALFAAARADVAPDVLDAARRGDHGAFGVIVAHYDHQLRGLAFRLLGDRTRMDDAMQEAYVKAFRSLGGFKGGARLGTWLHRITYNACIDELRRGRPAPEAGADVVSDGGPDEIAVERADLAAALAGLPVDQRAAVMLVDAYGYDYAEAADVLGVREGTIGSRLTRARAALRLALGWSES